MKNLHIHILQEQNLKASWR